MLAALLTPTSWESITGYFYDHLLNWEHQLSEYEALSGGKIPDDVKCSIVHRWAPMVIRRHLRVLPQTVMSNWMLLKSELQWMGVRNRVYGAEGVVSEPMDLNPVMQFNTFDEEEFDEEFDMEGNGEEIDLV